MTGRGAKEILLRAACALAICLTVPAQAQETGAQEGGTQDRDAQDRDAGAWSITPPQASFGRLDATLHAEGAGVTYMAAQDRLPGGARTNSAGGTGYLYLSPSLVRTYDSGLSIGLYADILALSDRHYIATRRKAFEHVYAALITGLGRVEIGQADGAAQVLGVAGPTLGTDTGLDPESLTPFLDPVTGKPVSPFVPSIPSYASDNYAKINLFTPNLFGFEAGVSFTPSQGRNVLPFLDAGPDVADRQSDLWEMALRYADTIGPVTVTGGGGMVFGHDDTKTAGHAGLTEYAAGVHASYDIDDDWSVSLGGGWHQSNAYAFDTGAVLAAGRTQNVQGAAKIAYARFSLGGEYLTGQADGAAALPALNFHITGVTAGWQVNEQFDLSLGWQQRVERRSAGVFYNGKPRFGGDSVLMQVRLKV